MPATRSNSPQDYNIIKTVKPNTALWRHHQIKSDTHVRKAHRLLKQIFKVIRMVVMKHLHSHCLISIKTRFKLLIHSNKYIRKVRLESSVKHMFWLLSKPVHALARSRFITTAGCGAHPAFVHRDHQNQKVNKFLVAALSPCVPHHQNDQWDTQKSLPLKMNTEKAKTLWLHTDSLHILPTLHV